jgi:uncharacterized protein (DUF1499 family)
LANVAVPSFAGRLDETSSQAVDAKAIVAPHQTITQKSATSQQSEASSGSASMNSPRRDSIANIAVPSFAGRLDKTSQAVDAKAVVAPRQTITQKSATSQQSEASSGSASMNSPRRDSMANIAVLSFAGRLDKTSQAVDAKAVVAPRQTITQKSATSPHSDIRGKHASRVQERPSNLEVTTNMRRLASGRRLQTNNAISRRMNWGGTAIDRRPGALSVNGRAPGRDPGWIQRLGNTNNPKRSSTQGKRTSSIQCEAFAIRHSLAVPGNFHVVRSSEMRTVKRASASRVPNRRISKLPTAEVALVNGELVHQSVREPQVISIRDATNFEADDLLKSRQNCMVSLFRFLGFKKNKKKENQPAADITEAVDDV